MDAAKVPLGQLPAPSTAFDPDIRVDLCGDSLSVKFEYDDEGTWRTGILRFDGVRAHMHRAENLCTVWHIEGAYDTIAEVVDSPWAAELKALDRERGHPFVGLRHFMIYIDSEGCYEVYGRSWALTR